MSVDEARDDGVMAQVDDRMSPAAGGEVEMAAILSPVTVM